MNQHHLPGQAIPFDEETNSAQALSEKLLDALTPGLHVEFDPEEAAKAGAFIEDALSEEDATQSCFDGGAFSIDTKDTGITGDITNE